MFRVIQTRLEYKILLLITAVLVIGFGTYVIITIQKESEHLVVAHHEKLWIYSETLMAGIRNVMLTGKAPFASELVNDVRQNLKEFGDLTIYDRLGREVFLREGEGIIPPVQDSLLEATLRTRSTQWSMREVGDSRVLTRYEPLRNSAECWRCHEPANPLRGVLRLALEPGAARADRLVDAELHVAGLLGDVVTAAFRNVMVGGGGEFMDTIMAASARVPTIRRARVFSRLGDVAFGEDDEDAVDEQEAEVVLQLLERKTTDRSFSRSGKTLRLYQPLANEERCQVCHGTRFPMRGIIVLEFFSDSLRAVSADPVRRMTQMFQSALLEGFRGIMLTGRAGSVRYFMEEIRALPFVRQVGVFDTEGSERFLNPPPRMRAETKQVAESLRAVEFLERRSDGERLVRLSPLLNEPRCFSCHGRNHTLRGVVEVSASMEEINAAVGANTLRSAAVGGVTIFLVWVILRMYMKSVVIRPVQEIEGVAARIGSGDFDVAAAIRSEDEIGSLARRINEMVQGLRERFHLEKFVSRETVDAVRRADRQGIRLGGERKMATVLFSDIRGFTSFAEKVDPETVVSVLNRYLSMQASVVRKHGGDIDKFVGDELVAVFKGDRMVEDALRAALEIQDEIERLKVEGKGEGISVGIGINAGEMVMGAMGSPDRMDYTVVGDSVNLGARVCSAARGGQVLLSESALKALRDPREFKIVALDPIRLKGKEQPVKVYEVRTRKAPSQGAERRTRSNNDAPHR